MSDPWTAAWEEAEATNPPVLVYDTLELIHPAFPSPIRVVSGMSDNVTLTLEAGAPVDGGAAVEWIACMFQAERPEVNEKQVPSCKVTIDNVGMIISPYLEEAVKTRANLEMTYRQYRSDDTTEPCYGPVTFQVKRVNITGTQLTGTASLQDLSNRKFPNKVYSFDDFPGLLAS